MCSVLKFSCPYFYCTSTDGPKQPTIPLCGMSKHRKQPPHTSISSLLPKQWIEKQRHRKIKSASKEATVSEMASVPSLFDVSTASGKVEQGLARGR